MSVDISHLSAHLPDAQRIAIQAEYERRAKSPTAAFLLCFFLGIFGAHRFYLRQPGAGVLRLILSPLVIPGIILEIVDLFRIDREVNALNLTLAEELIAANALDTHSPAIAAAVAQLNAARQAEQQTQQQTEQPAAGQPAQTPAAPAPSTPPPALEATVVTPISGDPGTSAASTIEVRQDAPPIWPVDPEIATITAAAAAAAVAEGADSAAGPEPATEPAPAMPADSLDITPEMVALAAAAADAEAPLSQGQAPAVLPVNEPPDESAPAAVDDALPAATPPLVESDAPVADPIPSRRADLTDVGIDDADLFDLADLGEPTGKRVVVRLPEAAADAAAAASAVDWTDASPVPASEPDADAALASAEMAEAMPVATPGDVPEEAIPVYTPSDAPADVLDDAPGDASEYADSLAQPLAEDTASLLLLPVEPSDAPLAPEAPEPPTMAEASEATGAAEAPAATTAAAAADDGYQADVSEELHDRWTDTGSHRIVKRVKVVRRLVINGQVVEEATAEQVVDADADTSATARNLQESLRGGDIQERIAALSTPLTPPAPAGNLAENPADTSEEASAPEDSTTPPVAEG